MIDKPLKRQKTFLSGGVVFTREWAWLLALGPLWIVLGILAIVMPFAAALPLERVLGAIFAVGGIALVIQAFGWRGFALHPTGGVLALFLGGLLLFLPVQGILTLALFLSAFFVAEGVVKVLPALQHKFFANRGCMLLSGVVGVSIGFLILLGLPWGGVVVLGLLVGAGLIFSAWSMAMLAASARRSHERKVGHGTSSVSPQGASVLR